MQNKRSFQDLLNTKLTPINLEDSFEHPGFIENQYTRIPVILNDSGEHFENWTRAHLNKIEQIFRKYGCVLFRNFSGLSPDGLQRLVEIHSPRLLNYTEASTPRSKVTGNIYTSTAYPQDQFIPMHNEHSYTREFPCRIWFHCHTPATSGGETPIADSRNVIKMIDQSLRDEFMRKKILYVRNYSEELDLPWQTVFGTNDKATLETYCLSNNIEFEWLGKEKLRTKQILPATLIHPVTKEMVWFNQAHLFHYSALEQSVANFLITKYGKENLPRNTYFGDGTEISVEKIDHIRAAYDRVKVVFPWQANDLLMLDNILFAHGRNPFEGNRSVYVAMADPASFSEINETAEKQQLIDDTRKKAAIYFTHNSNDASPAEKKYRLAAVFRMLSMAGLDDGISGHVTLRVPDKPNCFWTNPLGFLFEEITPDHLIMIDSKGALLEGNYPVNVAGFAIHSAIHEYRDDIECIVHTHSPWGTVFSTMNRKIEPLDQNSCMFYDNHAIYEEFHGAVNRADEAKRLQNALQNNNVLILKSHGTITCGQDMETATMFMIHVEKAYRTNYYSVLAGESGVVSDEIARETKEWVSNPIAFKIEFDALLRKVEREFPDLANYKPV